MKFTAEQIAQLRQIWAEDKQVTIKGINRYGEPFETTGKIATARVPKKEFKSYDERE